MASLTAVSSTNPMKIELPVQNDNKAKWDKLHVKWLEPLDNDPFVALAELPLGWSARRKPGKILEEKNFFILDASGVPKVDVWISTHDRCAKVCVFSAEEEIKAKEKLDVEDEFSQLLRMYHRQVEFTMGCGSRMQFLVNEAHQNLKEFANSHPECDFKIPKRKRVRDDGCSGLLTGLSIRNKYKNI